MAVDQISRTGQPLGLAAGTRWLLHHLLSLELLLVLFLHARHLKLILPATPVPETLFYGALSVAVGLWIILHDGIYRRGIPILIGGLLFTGWMVIAYGWTPEGKLARANLVFILGVNLWALFIAACVVAGSRERMIRFLLLLVLVTAVLSAIGAYIYAVHGTFRFYRGESELWEGRVYLNWGNIVATGAAIAMALAVHTRFGSVKQLMAATILGISFFFVMISGARGATLAILLAGLFALFVEKPNIRDGRIEVAKTQIVLLLVVAVLIGYVAYLLAVGQSPSTLNRFLALFDQAEDPLLRRGANRFDYFAGAYRAWLAAPLFGQGLYGFSYVFCGPAAFGCYPHNAILHVLADFGLIGLLLFLVFVASGVRHLGFARLRDDPLMFTLAMAFVTVIVNVMVASDTATNYRLFFFIGLLALRPPPDELDEPEENEAAEQDSLS